MEENRTIQEFLEELSSKQPTPGGGGASALAGALAGALGLMVGNLTIGKKKYQDSEDRVLELMGRLTSLRSEMVELMEEDARAFAPLARAYGLPSGTEEERDHKAKVMEENLKNASQVPLIVMEKTMEILKILEELGEKGSVMAVSDIGTGIQMARAALTGALMNVLINTRSMKCRDIAEAYRERAVKMLQDGTALADRVYGRVTERLQ
ncbi:MAG: cyclodeaminase/cyclohydrolase family protein [Hungatella sp.]